MGSRTHSERRCLQGSQKDANDHFIPPWLEVILEAVGHLFGRHFLMLFSKAFVSLLGRRFGAKGAQKAPKMEPKWGQKDAWGHFVGSAITMLFTVREAYGRVSGRLWEATFSRLCLQTLFGGVLECIFADFRRFGGLLWGPLGLHFGDKNVNFSGSDFWSLLGSLLGGAGGRGGAPGSLHIRQNMQNRA